MAALGGVAPGGAGTPSDASEQEHRAAATIQAGYRWRQERQQRVDDTSGSGRWSNSDVSEDSFEVEAAVILQSAQRARGCRGLMARRPPHTTSAQFMSAAFWGGVAHVTATEP
mmetsp:Transcript_8139/g.18206  ORF Transcript_8139/g.18206 Transcript_8139/m.18206 type:complete len:113 (-) Transcript_8139:218-556(-)